MKSIILDATSEILAWYDVDLTIQWINLAGAHLLGASREELIGRRCFEIWHNRAKPCDNCPVLRARDTRVPQDAEVVTADGRTWLLRVYPILDHQQNVAALVEFSLDISPQKEAERKLHQSQQQLRRLASERANVEERQRKRIADELHDRVGQGLIVAKFKADALSSMADTPEHDKACRLISEILGELIQETRSVIHELSCPTLYQFGLIGAMAEYLREEFPESRGVHARLDADVEPASLGDDTRAFFFRAVRELLRNVIKHAHAQHVIVSLACDDSQLRLEVADDGRGFTAIDAGVNLQQGHYGLFSIREYLLAIGGEMEIHSTPGQGARVILRAPLHPCSQSHAPGPVPPGSC
ncbi:MAG: PAS domain-containing protein [Sedimentisphaerales bacterium]|nr:PAS domain-containing protein [Sedimentisphaerales bacterium]